MPAPSAPIGPEGLPIRYGADPADVRSTRLGLVTELLWDAAKTAGAHPALAIEGRPSTSSATASSSSGGPWALWTWQQYADDAKAFAAALVLDPAVQLARFDAVVISAVGAPEWSIAQMGCIHAGGLAAGVFTSNGLDTTEFLLGHSGCAVAVVDTEQQVQKFLQAAKILAGKPQQQQQKRAGLRKIVVFGAQSAAIAAKYASATPTVPVVAWDAFLAFGATAAAATSAAAAVAARVAQTKVEHACVLIYTSGTTGMPKAVMVTHDNIRYQLLVGSRHNADAVAPGGAVERTVAYLPLSHIAGQIVDIFRPMFFAGRAFGVKTTVYFARPDAMRGTLVETLKAVRPTKLIGVPRVWEKFAAGVEQLAAAQPSMRRAMQFGIQAREAEQKNRQPPGSPAPPPPPAAILHFQQKLKESLGLDQVTFATTAAAPIGVQTLRTLAGIGLTVLEVYGMSECAGATTASTPHLYQWGAVGSAFPGTDLRTAHVRGRDNPNEGEICFRGRHIMLGYYKDAAKTAETVDADGWLHSGDVGRLCPTTGLLTVTGRLKELLITAGGENIAPVPIEHAIKTRCPALSHVVVVGDRMPFLVCLVTLKTKPNLATGYFTDELVEEAATLSKASKTVQDAIRDPLWLQTIHAAIDAYNRSDACVHTNHRVYKFAILRQDLSVPGGELTPTMKLRRAAILATHKAAVDAIYAAAPSKL
jgi:long-chain-fatty-acid--CoA ligase ACSBG